MSLANPLRPITQRLNTTPVEELPRYAAFLASSILNCADALRDADSQKGEESVLAHKIRTRVSSLLQDRTAEGRFAGIILTKSLIEVGGSQDLSTSAQWVRSLLSCLNKQDPLEVRKLAILTITRIYLVTKDNPSLVREVITPTLPTFITTCLSLIRNTTSRSRDSKQSYAPGLLTGPVLQCWHQLIYHFPATFRPHVNPIRSLVLEIVSNEITDSDTRDLAAGIFASLHFCAPKNTAGNVWAETCQQTIDSLHEAASLLFRSVREEWKPIARHRVASVKDQRARDEDGKVQVDTFDLPGWTDVQIGCSRMINLLQMLELLLTQKHAQAVNIPLAAVLDLTGRLTAVTSPTTQHSMRHNSEVRYQERDELYANLPRLHIATLHLLQALASTYGQVLRPISRAMVLQIWDTFEAESSHRQKRTAIYQAFQELLQQGIVSVQQADNSILSSIIHQCCVDLRTDLPKSSSNQSQSQVKPQSNQKKPASMILTLDTDKPSSNATSSLSRSDPELYNSACSLLTAILTHTPSHSLSSTIRAEVDGTAILIGHKEAMLASVLNPPVPRQKSKKAALPPSILPFLARTTNPNGARDISTEMGIEALMRPRMPVITTASSTMSVSESINHDGTHKNGRNAVVGEEYEEDEDDDSEDENDQDEDMEESKPVSSSSTVNARKRDFASMHDTTTLPHPETSNKTVDLNSSINNTTTNPSSTSSTTAPIQPESDNTTNKRPRTDDDSNVTNSSTTDAQQRSQQNQSIHNQTTTEINHNSSVPTSSSVYNMIHNPVTTTTTTIPTTTSAATTTTAPTIPNRDTTSQTLKTTADIISTNTDTISSSSSSSSGNPNNNRYNNSNKINNYGNSNDDGGNDSDSGDFEIPTIDTTMSTDDEEDGDEEDDDEE